MAAWALGGDNIAGTDYASWVAGYSTTASISVGTFSGFGSNQVRASNHMQAQTVARRAGEADLAWAELAQLITDHNLPERTADAMFDAVLGYRVRRATYLKRAAITDQTATRDLAALASAGILDAHGIGRGRYYTAGEPLRNIRRRQRARRAPLRDPYPWLRARLREDVA